MALMGPSGCGKTTLLNVLARRIPASNARISGATFVDGAKLDAASFKRISSYVEQEDALIGSLTVEETLKFAAELSLPRYSTHLNSGAPWRGTLDHSPNLSRSDPRQNRSVCTECASSLKHLAFKAKREPSLGHQFGKESAEARSVESVLPAS